MDISFILLLSGQGFKMLTTFLLIFRLYQKWGKQSKKYLSDFPFLTALSFSFLLLANFCDLAIWSISEYTPEFELNSTYNLLLKIRGIFSPFLFVIVLNYLLLTIWFQDKPKISYTLMIIWTSLGAFLLLFFNSAQQGLNVVPIVVFPTLILFSVTFFVIHKQKRLPGVNSLMVSLFMLLSTILQVVHPIWMSVGSGYWGLSWVGVICEAIGILGIGYGFIQPSKSLRE